MYHINTVLCLMKVNNNTIELKVHTSCYCVSELLCVIVLCFIFKAFLRRREYH